jgi:hypothetical protein
VLALALAAAGPADDAAKTLDAVIDLAPDRIALFGYAHLPSKLPHQRLVERAGRVLDSHERAALLLLGIERLTGAGYLHLGLDHFARPGSRLARAASKSARLAAACDSACFSSKGASVPTWTRFLFSATRRSAKSSAARCTLMFSRAKISS